MRYVLDILKDQLRSERQARGQAKQWLRGPGLDGGDRDDVRAFEESLHLAEKRIPQLEDAIELIGDAMSHRESKRRQPIS